MVVLGQKWLYSGKSGCIPVKIDVFGQSGCNRVKGGCIWAKSFFSGKVVVFGQRCCNRAGVFVFGQSGSIGTTVVVFGQSGCIEESSCI